MSYRLFAALFAAAVSATIACGNEAGQNVVPPPNPPPVQGDEVIRPTAVETLALAVEEHSLPPELQNDDTLSVAHLEGLGVLVGGTAGLFFLGTTGFEPLDASPVHALATMEPSGVLVASDRGLLIWNGALAESSLNAALSTEVVLAMATRGGDLYLGTASALWLLSAGELFQFTELTNVKSIDASLGANDIVVTREGAISGLRKEGADWILRTLSDEIGMSRAVPGSDDRIVSLENGLIKLRVAIGEDGVSWYPISLSLEASDAGATGVEILAVDPITGAVWAVDANAIVRIDHARVGKITRPAGMTAPRSIAVTADGAVWISDGITLRRFGNEGRPITFAENIAVFSQNNCERCHAPLKVAHPLDTYEAWAAEVDRIIDALETRRMPQDGAALVGGTVDLVRRWRDEGLRR
jgi:hypothetical protein